MSSIEWAVLSIFIQDTTIIESGCDSNVIPGTCEAYGDARLLSGVSTSEIKHLIEDELQKLSITEYHLDDLFSVPSVETDQEAELVQEFAQAVEAVPGEKPRIEGAGPACDGWLFITRGIPNGVRIWHNLLRCAWSRRMGRFREFASSHRVVCVYYHGISKVKKNARFRSLPFVRFSV